jgi:hypothetical protein
MGLSGGQQKQSSSSYGYSNAQSTNESQQSIYGPQAQQLQDMWGAGQANMAQDTSQFTGQNQQAIGAMQGQMGQMQQIGQTGGQIAQFANPNNQLVQDQIGNLGQSLGDFYSQQLNPAIRGSAVAAGGLGGGRQQVAQGMAAQDVGNQFRQGVTAIQANAYGQAQNAAGMADQNRFQAGQGMGQLGQSMNNLGMSNLNAPWMGAQNMAGLLGSPTVLGQSYAQQTASSRQGSQGQSKSNKFGLSLA